MAVLTILNKWKKATSNIDRIFIRAMLDNETEIIDANVAQLEVGKDSLGQFLDHYAYDSYAQFKQSIGSKAPFGIPDLILEGDFTSGFILRQSDNVFVIESTDEKMDHLRDKYGDDIFGLSDESLGELKRELVVSFIKYFRYELL